MALAAGERRALAHIEGVLRRSVALAGCPPAGPTRHKR